jgi:hypothetical protein
MSSKTQPIALAPNQIWRNRLGKLFRIGRKVEPGLWSIHHPIDAITGTPSIKEKKEMRTWTLVRTAREQSHRVALWQLDGPRSLSNMFYLGLMPRNARPRNSSGMERACLDVFTIDLASRAVRSGVHYMSFVDGSFSDRVPISRFSRSGQSWKLRIVDEATSKLIEHYGIDPTMVSMPDLSFAYESIGLCA